MNDTYKNKLDEIVYEFKDTYEEREISATMEFFFNEIIKRKRDDPYDGGLQASGIILKNKAGFKINENDGYGQHIESQINLLRYLNNKRKFYTQNAINKINVIKEDTRYILLKSTTVRLLCGENHIETYFLKEYDELSDFDKKIIRAFIRCCKILEEKNIIKNISVNVHSKDIDIDETVNSTSYNSIIKKLNEHNKTFKI